MVEVMVVHLVLFSLIYQYLQPIFIVLRNIFAEISSLKCFEIPLNSHNFSFVILCFKACSTIDLLMLFIFIVLKLLSVLVVSPIIIFPFSSFVCVLTPIFVTPPLLYFLNDIFPIPLFWAILNKYVIHHWISTTLLSSQVTPIACDGFITLELWLCKCIIIVYLAIGYSIFNVLS